MARTLTIKRKWHLLSGIAVSLKVILDDNVIGSLGNGAESTWEISPGAHKLTVYSIGTNVGTALIPAGSNNVAFLANNNAVSGMKTGWTLKPIEAPVSNSAPISSSTTVTQQAKAGPSKAEIYLDKILSLSGRGLENDPDAIQQLEDLKSQTQELISQEAASDPAWFGIGWIHFFSLAKHYMEDDYDTEEAKDNIKMALTYFDQEKYANAWPKGINGENEKAFHEKALIYDAYCKYCDEQYREAMNTLQDVTADTRTLAIAGCCLVQIGIQEQGDVYPPYQVLSQWETLIQKSDSKITAEYEQELFRIAYGYFVLLTIKSREWGEYRIPAEASDMVALIQRMEKFKTRLVNEEEIDLVETHIQKCRDYLAEL